MKKNLLFATLFFLTSVTIFSQNDSESSRDEYRNQGYFNITRLSYITMTSLKQELFIEGEGNFFSDLENSGAHAWSLQTINGYFISPYFSLGVGIGLDGHHDPTYNTMPLFLDARAYLSDDGESLYSYLDFGPTLRLGGESSEFRKGVLFNLGVGYKFNVSERLFLVSDLFYSHKTVSLTGEGISTSDNIIKSNGVGLSLGIIF